MIFQVLSLDPAVGAHLEGEEDGSGTRGFTAPRPRQELESWTKHSGFCWQRLAEVVAGINYSEQDAGLFWKIGCTGPAGNRQCESRRALIGRSGYATDDRTCQETAVKSPEGRA